MISENISVTLTEHHLQLTQQLTAVLLHLCYLNILKV